MGRSWRAYDKPAIAQLAEHLTVELCSYQMVPDLQMWEAGQGGVCASDAAFLCSSNCCSLAILFTNLFANLFANLFRYSREESGRLKKERLHVSCLMSLCAWVFSFFIKNLQMPLKQVCK